MRLLLGAGCSGLGLARAMVTAGLREPLVLVDRRTQFENDRTWCLWQTDPAVPRTGTPHHAWHTWQLIGPGGEVVRHTSARHPYLQVRADDYYAASLDELASHDHVTLLLGQRVTEVSRAGDGRIAVSTSAGDLLADHVYDAMGGAGPLAAGDPGGAIELRQSFLGLEIETTRPTFDPSIATLMDFRTGAGPDDPGGLHFMYLLPTSPTHALVEHTTLGPRTVAPAARRASIATYLARHWATVDYAVVREERGTLPMSSRVMPLSRGPNIDAVGAAAGAIRPSSGYAFVRIQRHADAVAQAAVAGRPVPARIGRARHQLMDQLFLRALAVDPPAFAGMLLALAEHTSADVFARFMSDASTPSDELQVMRALARRQFLVPMAASSVLRPVAPRGREPAP